MKSFVNHILHNVTGEIATTLTIIAIVVMTAGIFAGSKLTQQDTTTDTSAQTACDSVTGVSSSPGAPLSAGQNFRCSLTLASSANQGSPNMSCGWSLNGGWPQNGGRWENAWCSGGNCGFDIRMDSTVQQGTYELVGFDMRSHCGPNHPSAKRITLQSSGGGTSPQPTQPPPTQGPQPTQPPTYPTSTPVPPTQPTNTPTPIACIQQSGTCSNLDCVNLNDPQNNKYYERASSSLGCSTAYCCLPANPPTATPANCPSQSFCISNCTSPNTECVRRGSCYDCVPKDTPTPTPIPGVQCAQDYPGAICIDYGLCNSDSSRISKGSSDCGGLGVCCAPKPTPTPTPNYGCFPSDYTCNNKCNISCSYDPNRSCWTCPTPTPTLRGVTIIPLSPTTRPIVQSCSTGYECMDPDLCRNGVGAIPLDGSCNANKPTYQCCPVPAEPEPTPQGEFPDIDSDVGDAEFIDNGDAIVVEGETEFKLYIPIIGGRKAKQEIYYIPYLSADVDKPYESAIITDEPIEE